MRNLRALLEERLPPPPSPRTWLTTKEAAQIVGREEQTITNWCRGPHRIGTLVLGRWRVDRVALRRFLIERFGFEHLPDALR